MHPVSDTERAFGVLFLLGGVATTTYIMDSLMGMIKKLQELNKDYEEANQLGQFMGTLERFNRRKRLPEKLLA